MSEATSSSAPWEAASPTDQLFVLITGANSGIGLATAYRLIDEFLTTRSAASHLILIATTRSAAKSAQTIQRIAAYAAPRAPHRIHVLSPILDVCDLRAVAAFAQSLAAVPRLDAVVFNAAYGGWVGCDYAMAVWSVLTRGFMQSVTWPTYKIALPTCLLNWRSGYAYPPEPRLGEVFTACVFGHYFLAHHLAPLLRRAPSSSLSPARIIWSSSLEAIESVFSPDDLQCLHGSSAYESAKRLTDILALTCSLPSARPYSLRWLSGLPRDKDSASHDMDSMTRQQSSTTHDNDSTPPHTSSLPQLQNDSIPPQVYLSHPGIVASTLFPLPWFLFWAYELTLIVARWLGSPWHVGAPYAGAAAAAWLVLEPDEALAHVDDVYAADASTSKDKSSSKEKSISTISAPLSAQHIKWGSATTRRGRSAVKPTEVDGWGFDGRPCTSTLATTSSSSSSSALPTTSTSSPSFASTPRVLRRSIGRRLGARDPTPDDILHFEELGARCWREMEELRAQWSDILNLEPQ